MINATIESLQSSECADAAELLSRAFLTDPMAQALLGYNSDKAERTLARVFRLMLDVLPAKMMCIRDGTRIVAVMRIAAPGKCQRTGRQMVRAIPELLVATRSMMPRFISYLSLLKKHDPADRHWHLSLFAVDPDSQRKGMGTCMLDYFCNYVDSLGESAYLETNKASSVKLYERFGFTVVQEEPLLDVRNWFMWRPYQGTP
jgi:ribosomal protein S18 acetylase RimI-like enzyme